MTFWHKFKFSNPNIFATWWCKHLIFQTLINWSNRNHSLNLSSTKLGCKNIRIWKSEFVAKDFSPSGNFPRLFSLMTTSQMCNFPSGNFPTQVCPRRSAWPQSVIAAALGLLVYPSRSARPQLKPVAPQRTKPNLWEVTAWEIAHLGSCHFGNCHLGSRPWDNAFGKYT